MPCFKTQVTCTARRRRPDRRGPQRPGGRRTRSAWRRCGRVREEHARTIEPARASAREAQGLGASDRRPRQRGVRAHAGRGPVHVGDRTAPDARQPADGRADTTVGCVEDAPAPMFRRRSVFSTHLTSPRIAAHRSGGGGQDRRVRRRRTSSRHSSGASSTHPTTTTTTTSPRGRGPASTAGRWPRRRRRTPPGRVDGQLAAEDPRQGRGVAGDVRVPHHLRVGRRLALDRMQSKKLRAWAETSRPIVGGLRRQRLELAP